MTAISYERVELHTIPSVEGVPLGYWEGRVKELTHPELHKIYVLPTRQEAARLAAEKILEVVKEKPDAAISWPSGNQGNSVIDQVVKLSKERNISFDKVQFFQLDEYYPIDPTHTESFRNKLRKRLYEPLNIPQDHIHEIAADPGSDGDQVATAYERLLQQTGIDLVLHPIGPDGHMAFAEAGTPLDSVTHVTQLSSKTLHRDRVIRGLHIPDHAITQGISTMLRAKKILFINLSPEYKDDMKKALYGPVGSHNPSSFLRTVGDKVEAITTHEISAQFPPH